MFRSRLFPTAVLVLLVATATALRAQPTLSPESLTNRHIADGVDATATAWNPAMLGIYPDAFEIAAGAPFGRWRLDGNTGIGFVNSPLYLFTRFGPIGLGYESRWNNDAVADSLGMTHPGYYAGFGFSVTPKLWVGASLRGNDQEKFFSSASYTFSGVYRPMDGLLVSAATDDFTRFRGYAAYAPLTWATILGRFAVDPADTLDGKSAARISAGLALGARDLPIHLSLSYEFTRSVLRAGLELAFDDDPSEWRAGVFAEMDSSDIGGGAAVVRWSSKRPQTVEPSDAFEPSPYVATHSRGWAPDRAFTPTGLYYRTPTNDAAATPEALVRPCDRVVTEMDDPTGLTASLARGGGTYASLLRRTHELAPNPANLYKAIRQEYYTTTVRSRELMRGDSLQLAVRQGYSIGVQSVDQTKFPEVSMIVQVTDPSGRNVRGLGMNDFVFRDPTLAVKSVRPIDATFNVPVDIVMIIDCSGSMRDEIQSVRANVETFVNTMEARGADYRIGGVLYGALIYDTLHPTGDIQTFKRFAASADAIGNDEITTLAIKTATEMNFRPGSQRLFVLITDDWQVQDNALLGEPDIVEMLWNAGARLYSIDDPCKNNGAVMTRLSLGREYNITSPFSSLLDEIGNDVTTLYQVVYESKVKPEEVTILRGSLRDETGRPASVPIQLRAPNGGTRSIAPNATTGEFETEITEGVRYDVAISGGRYLPLADVVDLTTTRRGEIVERNFTLRLPPTMLAGTVTDERGTPVSADVRIEDAETGERINTIRTSANGQYETTIAEGRMYRLVAINPDYIPTPADLDARGVERGTNLTQNLKVTSIETAIATGATFKVKNIFFDVAKAELKAESFLELNRLVQLLKEYPTINVEIGAHTDATGTERDNQLLSENRARSVVEYLTAKGIVAVRLRARGYGESAPVATNDNDDGRALNRRVEFKLVR